MTYSLVGILAIVLTFLLNAEFFLYPKRTFSNFATRQYMWMVISFMAFFISDALWGVLYENNLYTAAFIDTTVYFIAMSASVLFWTRYATDYLQWKKSLTIALRGIGWAIFAFGFVLLIVNIFVPALFVLNEAEGGYRALSMRYAYFIAQIVMFALTSGYAFAFAFSHKGSGRFRHLAVAIFGLDMAVAIALQVIYPFLPIYAVGCMVGLAIVHVFVVGADKEEARRNLEQSYEREKKQKEELHTARVLAYTDPLTGAKSKHAYVEREEEIDRLIGNDEIKAFSVVVFDINGLKHLNDTKGHEAGDEYIKACYGLITSIYQGIPIYRFGGDEFAAILDEEHNVHADEYHKKMLSSVEGNLSTEGLIVAVGSSEFEHSKDNTFRAVFTRADMNMYVNKASLKKKQKQDFASR